MKIINRKQFMRLPPGVICCEGEPWVFGGWFIKDGNCGDNDYYMTTLDWTQYDNSCSGMLFNMADAALAHGVRLDMTFEESGRDGCFENGAIYCVLEDADIERLVKRLLAGKGKI